jgi:metal-responsive CopG/Arc/MetJ family transcriptional regulator
MKTAISMSDDLLREADTVARKMGLSRSKLFSIALESYLRSRRHAEIRERLNQVFADGLDSDERQVLAGMKRKFAATLKDRWSGTSVRAMSSGWISALR